MNANPLVSIVTPSYNQGEFIESTILSVRNQEYPKIEHIVVDGGSTDNTLSILKKHENEYDLKWTSEPDKGQSDAVNKGFKMARGEIIGWLNSDDAYFDTRVISDVVKYFNKYYDADVIYGNAVMINENNLILSIIKKIRRFDYNHLRKICFIVQPAVFLRTRIINHFELDVSLKFAMDYDFWLRIGKKHNFRFVKRIFAVDRCHEKRKTIGNKDKVIRESSQVSKQFGNWSWLDRLSDVCLYPLRSTYWLIQVGRLYRCRYNLAFDMKFDSILPTTLRQIKPSVRDYLLTIHA